MNNHIILSQSIRLPYRYTAGLMHKAALRGLAEQKIVGSRCGSCSFVVAPARPFCPSCSGATTEVVELEPSGTVRSWTIFDRDGHSEAMGRIQLDGADNAFLHRLASDHEWATGMRVKAAWADIPATEITSIDRFVPMV